MITEKRIQSFTDFHQIIHEHNKHWSRWFYRGESSLEHKLVPKAGRPHFVAKNLNDKDIFERWCRHAVAYFDKPVENQWDFLLNFLKTKAGVPTLLFLLVFYYV